MVVWISWSYLWSKLWSVVSKASEYRIIQLMKKIYGNEFVRVDNSRFNSTFMLSNDPVVSVWFRLETVSCLHWTSSNLTSTASLALNFLCASVSACLYYTAMMRHLSVRWLNGWESFWCLIGMVLLCTKAEVGDIIENRVLFSASFSKFWSWFLRKSAVETVHPRDKDSFQFIDLSFQFQQPIKTGFTTV